MATATCQTVLVFPTCVGVFPPGGIPGAGRGGLPHVRGGVSWPSLSGNASAMSSPRAWGCFLCPRKESCAAGSSHLIEGCFNKPIPPTRNVATGGNGSVSAGRRRYEGDHTGRRARHRRSVACCKCPGARSSPWQRGRRRIDLILAALFRTFRVARFTSLRAAGLSAFWVAGFGALQVAGLDH